MVADGNAFEVYNAGIDAQGPTVRVPREDVASVDLRGRSSFPGRSSPAIGPDGSVYLAIGSYLHCYLAPEPSIGADMGLWSDGRLTPAAGDASRFLVRR